MTAPVHLFVEPFAGTASVSLCLLDLKLKPLCAYVGSKHTYAPDILKAMGLAPGQGMDFLILCDTGPWRDVWATFSDSFGGSVEVVASGLRILEKIHPDPVEAWDYLLHSGQTPWAHIHVLSYLWLQARTVQGLAIWYDRDKHQWVMGDGTAKEPKISPPRQMCRDQWAQYKAGTRGRGSLGILHPSTIADRIEAIQKALDEVGTCLEAGKGPATPLPLQDMPRKKVYVYMDPPYQTGTPYANTCTRGEVVTMAQAWQEVGATVAVSEAEPLTALEGWEYIDLSRKRTGRDRKEWLTVWRP